MIPASIDKMALFRILITTGLWEVSLKIKISNCCLAGFRVPSQSVLEKTPKLVREVEVHLRTPESKRTTKESKIWT